MILRTQRDWVTWWEVIQRREKRCHISWERGVEQKNCPAVANKMAGGVRGMSGSLRDSYRTWFTETVKMKAARAPLEDYKEQGTRGWKTGEPWGGKGWMQLSWLLLKWGEGLYSRLLPWGREVVHNLDESGMLATGGWEEVSRREIPRGGSQGKEEGVAVLSEGKSTT